MESRLANAYRKARSEYPYLPANQCMRIARGATAESRYFKVRRLWGEWETIDIGAGYELRARLERDDVYETPWEHDETSFGTPEAINNRRWINSRGETPGNGFSHLASHDRDEWIYPYDAALARARAEFTSAKCGVAERDARARAAVDSERERFASWLHDDWCYVGVIVELLDGDDGIVARESLWGIESDCDDYIVETANELAGQCIADSNMRFARAATLETC